MACQQTHQVVGIPSGVVIHHHQSAARRQRTEDLPYREIEGGRVEPGPHVVGTRPDL